MTSAPASARGGAGASRIQCTNNNVLSTVGTHRGQLPEPTKASQTLIPNWIDSNGDNLPIIHALPSLTADLHELLN